MSCVRATGFRLLPVMMALLSGRKLLATKHFVMLEEKIIFSNMEIGDEL
jgi:hypothetical protein